jgi:hypothetical protein
MLTHVSRFYTQSASCAPWLHDGVSRSQFLGTNDAVSSWISQPPGFLSRELSYDAEGDRWIDILWWDTMENAHAAAELAMTSESCTPRSPRSTWSRPFCSMARQRSRRCMPNADGM